ncbi:hypothetical protein V1478_012651 [Vespula squamosa]|uniref:Uncharacterized protein n=1 Tax=Vespula squamosa TaxID=30214 RepID=A0ABD2A8L2_VESSQ
MQFWLACLRSHVTFQAIALKRSIANGTTIFVLTAIKGFMPASTMPLGSVTPWMVEQGPLYSQEKQGDMWGPHEEETGSLGG